MAVATVLSAMGGLKAVKGMGKSPIFTVATVLSAMGGLKVYTLIAQLQRPPSCNRPLSNGRVESCFRAN